MMKASNMSIVIAPNILRPKEETMESRVGDSSKCLRIVQLLIEIAPDLWPKRKTILPPSRQSISEKKDEKENESNQLLGRFKATYSDSSSKFLNSVISSQARLTNAWQAIFSAFQKNEKKISSELLHETLLSTHNEENWRAVVLQQQSRMASELEALAKFLDHPETYAPSGSKSPKSPSTGGRSSIRKDA